MTGFPKILAPALAFVVTVLALSSAAPAQTAKPKSGLTEEDWKYSLAPGVTTRELTYYYSAGFHTG